MVDTLRTQVIVFDPQGDVEKRRVNGPASKQSLLIMNRPRSLLVITGRIDAFY